MLRTSNGLATTKHRVMTDD